jgi:hypothetical protein
MFHLEADEYCFYSLRSISLASWRGGRAAEGARLESVYTATYRGFESLSLRQNESQNLIATNKLNYSIH